MKKAFLFLSLLSMVSWKKQYPTTNVSQGNELESLEKNVNQKDIDISGTWEYIKKDKGADVPEFYSFFGSPKDKGKVKIIVNNDKTLTWKVIKDPKSPFYCPGECILTQQK